ncbi:hypothetical protein KAU55_03315 [Candidatus Bathyarchaeota archaeon]|nr:hypothetical protein [Candidatus Bathyarchaeota archaeon]
MKTRVQRYYGDTSKSEIEIQRYPDGWIKLVKGSSEDSLWIIGKERCTWMSKNQRFERIMKQILHSHDAYCDSLIRKPETEQ